MVGIVVVSHSRALADAAVALARQMLHGRDVRIAVAAGLDETTLGTDAVQIMSAIEAVDGPDGTLVLMDLGSAVLSAELALDLLDPSIKERVALCAGPLVEGLVVATVAAAGGARLADVTSEASSALAGKQSHLGQATPEPDTPLWTPTAASVFTVHNEHGLHARPAARLVGEVRGLDARVMLRNLTTDSPAVPAASLSRVATLGALQGHQIEVAADGRQAREAVEHVLALAARQFDEVSADHAPQALSSSGPLAASPGIAIGPKWTPKVPTLAIPSTPSGDAATEWRRLRGAVADVRRETVLLRARTARDLGEAHAAIFDAHLMMLDDREILDHAHRAVEEGSAAEAAWAEAMRALEAQMAGLADSYQRARAADVRGVADQVLQALLGVSARFDAQDGVLVAADLTPADASELDPTRVKGIVLTQGSPTSHSAILARTLGIPMIVAAGQAILRVPDGTIVCFDGDANVIDIDPDRQTIERYQAKAAARHLAHTEALAAAAQPARTKDCVGIEVAANIGSLPDAKQAASAGADSAGLIRTEFLFLNRAEAPDIDEQEEAYLAIAEALDGKRITLRTLDVGGDKPLSYLPSAPEANPFLGLRGIRFSLARRELLRDQLIAACRVARRTPVSLMFPMVSTVDELKTALKVLDEAAGGARPAGLKVGIMVEVPAAALKAKAFVPYVDFFSIGTNDLTQYTLAAERGNDAVAGLSDPLDPAVLRLIDTVCRAASGRVEVAVCGEAASDGTAIPLLIGLGVRELSVVPAAIPLVKQAVRRVDAAAAAAQAWTALDAPDAGHVRSMVESSASHTTPRS
jgi:phosphocarrier protein FPr